MQQTLCPVLESDFTEEGGYAAAARLARGTDLVFAVTDMMAIGAMRAMRAAGLDIAVAGFGGIDAAQDAGLTTVHVPLRGMGAAAVDLALSGEREVRWLQVKPVLRASTPRRRPTGPGRGMAT